jgi:hypothetical protein
MVNFIDVDPDLIPNMRTPHRGRVSYPILKTFLETGKVVAQLDRTGIQQSFQSLYSSVSAYIRNHELPINLFSREGEIYLARTDLDENGNVKPTTLDAVAQDKRAKIGIAPKELLEDETIPDIDDEVEERYQEEKGQVTK